MLKFSNVLALVVVALSVLATLVLCARPKWHQLEGYTFEKYVEDFNKPHQKGTSEYLMREKIFYSKLQKIKSINTDPSSTWKAGVNTFTDMTDAEWKRFNGHKDSGAPVAAPKKVVGAPAGYQPPKSKDWRLSAPAVITPVKHQGSCGSCWAHAATEAMETYYAFATGKLPLLSVGQTNQCTPPPYSYGCDGGEASAAFTYYENPATPPLTEAEAYPNEAFFFPTTGNAPTPACYNISSKFLNKKPYNWFAELTQVGTNGYNAVATNNATAAIYALAEIGPQAISVAAGNWQWYEEGIMQNTAKNGEDNEWSVDHAVYMVGYGVDTVLQNGKLVETGYWIVQNSWSTNWGEGGFVRLWRSLDGNEPCSPPSMGPQVCGTSGCLNGLKHPIIRVDKPINF